MSLSTLVFWLFDVENIRRHDGCNKWWRWLQLLFREGWRGLHDSFDELVPLITPARGQSWNESLKSRWIPEGSCGYTSGTRRKHFAALSSPRPCWRWLQLQPPCGSPQCFVLFMKNVHSISTHIHLYWSCFGLVFVKSNMISNINVIITNIQRW